MKVCQSSVQAVKFVLGGRECSCHTITIHNMHPTGDSVALIAKLQNNKSTDNHILTLKTIAFEDKNVYLCSFMEDVYTSLDLS